MYNNFIFASEMCPPLFMFKNCFLCLQQVTKGARNKLAQSIAKLRERTSELRTMETSVVQGTSRHSFISLHQLNNKL